MFPWWRFGWLNVQYRFFLLRRFCFDGRSFYFFLWGFLDLLLEILPIVIIKIIIIIFFLFLLFGFFFKRQRFTHIFFLSGFLGRWVICNIFFELHVIFDSIFAHIFDTRHFFITTEIVGICVWIFCRLFGDLLFKLFIHIIIDIHIALQIHIFYVWVFLGRVPAFRLDFVDWVAAADRRQFVGTGIIVEKIIIIDRLGFFIVGFFVFGDIINIIKVVTRWSMMNNGFFLFLLI